MAKHQQRTPVKVPAQMDNKETVKQLKNPSLKETLTAKIEFYNHQLKIMINNAGTLDTMIKQTQGKVQELSDLLKEQDIK